MSDQEDIMNSIDIKVRKLVRELMEPNLIKFSHLESAVEKISRSINETKDRISVAQNKADALHSKIPNIEPLKNRVSENTLKINSVEYDLKSQLESIKNQIEMILTRTGDIGSKYYQLTKQYDMFSKILSENTNTCKSLRNYIEDKVKEFSGQVKEPLNQQSETNIAFQLQIKDLNDKFDTITNDFSSIELQSKKCEHRLNVMSEDFEFKLKRNAQPDFNRSEMDGLRNLVKYSEEKIRNELDLTKKNLELLLEEYINELEKNQENSIGNILDFVLIEPRYKKKINELREIQKRRNKDYENTKKTTALIMEVQEDEGLKQKNRESIFRHYKKRIDLSTQLKGESTSNENRFSNVSLIKSEDLAKNEVEKPENSRSMKREKQNEYPETGVIGAAEAGSGLEDLKANNDAVLMMEDLQNNLENLRNKHQELHSLVLDNSSKSSIKLTSFKVTLAVIKEQLEKQIKEVKQNLELFFKTFVEEHSANFYEKISTEVEKEQKSVNLEISSIKENHLSLETLLKSSSYDFFNYISTKKRDQSDIKIELSRIYTKIDTINKKQEISQKNYESVQSTLRSLKKYFPSQSPTSNSEIESKIESLTEKNNESRSIQSPYSMKSNNTKKYSREKTMNLEVELASQPAFKIRSHTPELPNISRLKYN